MREDSACMDLSADELDLNSSCLLLFAPDSSSVEEKWGIMILSTRRSQLITAGGADQGSSVEENWDHEEVKA